MILDIKAQINYGNSIFKMKVENFQFLQAKNPVFKRKFSASLFISTSYTMVLFNKFLNIEKFF